MSCGVFYSSFSKFSLFPLLLFIINLSIFIHALILLFHLPFKSTGSLVHSDLPHPCFYSTSVCYHTSGKHSPLRPFMSSLHTPSYLRKSSLTSGIESSSLGLGISLIIKSFSSHLTRWTERSGWFQVQCSLSISQQASQHHIIDLHHHSSSSKEETSLSPLKP